MWFRLSEIGDVAYISEPQAFIRIRKEGDQTSVFRWAEVVGRLNMWYDHQELMFGADHRGIYYRARYVIRRDLLLLRLMLQAILLESPPVVKKGEAIIRTHASPWIKVLSKIVVKSPALQGFLRRWILPIHYRKTSQHFKAREREAITYLQVNS